MHHGSIALPLNFREKRERPSCGMESDLDLIPFVSTVSP